MKTLKVFFQFVRRSRTRLRCFVFGSLVRRRAAEVGAGLKVNHYSTVTRTTHLGTNVNFNGMKIVGSGRVVIGDNFHSGEGCLMISETHNYLGTALPYDETYLEKPITIGENVWLGSRVIVLGGVTIGEGAIVQAGSVVVGDLPPCSIAGGHPARVFRSRDGEHYRMLKAAGRFH